MLARNELTGVSLNPGSVELSFFEHPRPRNSSARRRGRQTYSWRIYRTGPARCGANGGEPARCARQERGGARSRSAETAKSDAVGRVINPSRLSTSATRSGFDLFPAQAVAACRSKARRGSLLPSRSTAKAATHDRNGTSSC
jgi:hypothetical protein